MFFSKTRQFAPSLPVCKITSNTSGPYDLSQKSGIRFEIRTSWKSILYNFCPGQIHKKRSSSADLQKPNNKISRTRIILTKTKYLFNFMPPDTTKICLFCFNDYPPNPPQNLREIRSPPFRLKPFFLDVPSGWVPGVGEFFQLQKYLRFHTHFSETSLALVRAISGHMADPEREAAMPWCHGFGYGGFVISQDGVERNENTKALHEKKHREFRNDLFCWNIAAANPPPPPKRKSKGSSFNHQFRGASSGICFLVPWRVIFPPVTVERQQLNSASDSPQE